MKLLEYLIDNLITQAPEQDLNLQQTNVSFNRMEGFLIMMY